MNIEIFIILVLCFVSSERDNTSSTRKVLERAEEQTTTSIGLKFEPNNDGFDERKAIIVRIRLKSN